MNTLTELYWPLVVLGAFGMVAHIAHEAFKLWNKRLEQLAAHTEQLKVANDNVSRIQDAMNKLADRVQAIDNRTAVRPGVPR